MLMRNFLSSRKSIREFKGKNISGKDMQKVQEIVSAVQNKVDGNLVQFTLIDEGKGFGKALEGKAGYAGVMIKAPAYIAMDIVDASPKGQFTAAYAMEEIITGLIEIGLGSCWISLTDVHAGGQEVIQGFNVHKAEYLLAFGYPMNTMGIGDTPYSSRMGVEDIVYKERLGNPMTVEELETLGLDDLFYYVRFAPSAHNEQPWRYVVNNGSVDMYMKDTGKNYWIEAGIAAYYLEQLAHTMSIPHRFVLEETSTEGEYKHIGSLQV